MQRHITLTTAFVMKLTNKQRKKQVYILHFCMKIGSEIRRNHSYLLHGYHVIRIRNNGIIVGWKEDMMAMKEMSYKTILYIVPTNIFLDWKKVLKYSKKFPDEKHLNFLSETHYFVVLRDHECLTSKKVQMDFFFFCFWAMPKTGILTKKSLWQSRKKEEGNFLNNGNEYEKKWVCHDIFWLKFCYKLSFTDYRDKRRMIKII